MITENSILSSIVAPYVHNLFSLSYITIVRKHFVYYVIIFVVICNVELVCNVSQQQIIVQFDVQSLIQISQLRITFHKQHQLTF